MPEDKAQSAQQTYFGLASLGSAVLSAIFLGALFAVSQLHISMETFKFWNNLIALFYCLATPLTILLIILTLRSKRDSKWLAGFAAAAIGIPFLILFVQFLSAITITR